MPRGVKKENLPEKVCTVFNRSFTWRKKWECCWAEVTTCSKGCNSARRQLRAASSDVGEYSAAEDISGQERGGDQSDIPAAEGAPLRQERKAAATAAKALKRAKREGTAPPDAGQKACDTCAKGCDLLVRCQVDESKAWRLVCGRCWKSASGGVADGDGAHPHYRYGGLWKNRVTREVTMAPALPSDLLETPHRLAQREEEDGVTMVTSRSDTWPRPCTRQRLMKHLTLGAWPRRCEHLCRGRRTGDGGAAIVICRRWLGLGSLAY